MTGRPIATALFWYRVAPVQRVSTLVTCVKQIAILFVASVGVIRWTEHEEV